MNVIMSQLINKIAQSFAIWMPKKHMPSLHAPSYQLKPPSRVPKPRKIDNVFHSLSMFLRYIKYARSQQCTYRPYACKSVLSLHRSRSCTLQKSWGLFQGCNGAKVIEERYGIHLGHLMLKIRKKRYNQQPEKHQP